jgi:2-C-methyl-D-erythritol 2,4-cyclodiphosphate synthase
MFRIGHSQDTHRLVTGRPLILGGINIPYEKGLLGHSDADVVLHVVSEAIIGALGLGDLGTHFPDANDAYKDRASSYFVIEANKMMQEKGYKISNIDLSVYLEFPNLTAYKRLMKENIANILGISSEQVNIKATRLEGLGFIGRQEGISAECVVLLESRPQRRRL